MSKLDGLLNKTVDIDTGSLFPLSVEKDPLLTGTRKRLLEFALKTHKQSFLFEGLSQDALVGTFGELKRIPSWMMAFCIPLYDYSDEERLETLLDHINGRGGWPAPVHSYLFRSGSDIAGYARIMEGYYDDPTIEDAKIVLAAVHPDYAHLAIPIGKTIIHELMTSYSGGV